MADRPRFLNPFVLDEPARDPVSDETADWYLPDTLDRRPAVLFVHGGAVRPELSPKDWPVFRGYGSMAARRGLVGVTFNHPFHDWDVMPTALAAIEGVVERAREHDRVDPERIGLWAFSGAGLLVGHFVQRPAEWLRAVALTYPDCRRDDDLPDTLVSLSDAVEQSSNLPILLTRVGRERDELAVAVDEFLGAAEGVAANLTVIDVPNGEHGFDHADATEESRHAVVAAMAWMVEELGR